MPDTLGFRKRIGIVVPSTNTTVQPECDVLRPPGVTNHIGRSTIKERPLKMRSEQFLATIKRSAEFMKSLVELSRHTGILRPLSCKEKCQRLTFARSPKDTGTGTALCE